MNPITRLTLAVAALLIAILLLTSAPAWAINKCAGPGGGTVFQDAPCAGAGGEIEVRPASGYAAPPPASQAGALGEQHPMTEAQRLNVQTEKTQREWRKRDLANAISRNNADCEREQDKLRASKIHANNNLAGATWEQSISQEMTAAAARCDTRARQLAQELDELNKKP